MCLIYIFTYNNIFVLFNIPAAGFSRLDKKAVAGVVCSFPPLRAPVGNETK